MIGIFDSGVGGLTVARAIKQQLPGYDMMYFGDTAHTPYGTKSAETVVGYTINNIKFLLSRGAELIVIACNTASSVAAAPVLKQFSVPIFEVITPAVELAVQALWKVSRGPKSIRWPVRFWCPWLRRGGWIKQRRP